MGHGLREQCLLFNGANLTFSLLLAHCTRVRQLDHTKQLTPAPSEEFPPGFWRELGLGKERSDSPEGYQCTHQAWKQGSEGEQWHGEDRELVGGGLQVQRAHQAATGICKCKPDTRF